MEPEGTHIDKIFREFQSSFNQASPEERQRLTARLYRWIEKQAELLPDHPADTSRPDAPDGRRHTIPAESSTPITPVSLTRGLQTLIENKTQLNQIAGKIEQVFWLSEFQSGRILYASPAFETVWGYSRESLYADPSILIESVHPEDRVQVLVANPRSDLKPFNQSYRILRLDGSLRWILARTFIICDESGAPYSLFCIAQDITGQKQVELQLQKSLERSREQFDLSRRMSLARKPEAVLKTLMSAQELRSAQRAALLFFDNPRGELARRVELTASWLSSHNLSPWLSESSLYEEPALWELLNPNRAVVITGISSNPRLTPLVRDFLLEGKIQTLVIFPLVASGDWLGCLLVYYRQEIHFDHIELRHLKVLVDQATITLYNLRLLEVEEDSRHEAERANEIKTGFLAMISHELRTPLTSIIGYTTTLLAEDVAWEPDEQSDFIQTIQREARRLEELIDHLLVLSRLEAGMLPISPEPVTLHEILDDVLPQFQILTSGHRLTTHLPASLPPVYVDSRRIAQVLVNLVRNASTYAPEGTEINISASVRGSFVQINVSDQGPGISPTDHKWVFKAFQRGANVEKSLAQGAGLGLAICKGLVEAHGGRIWIKKKTTPGATVSFTIPLVPLYAPLKLAEKER